MHDVKPNTEAVRPEVLLLRRRNRYLHSARGRCCLVVPPLFAPPGRWALVSAAARLMY